MTGSRPTLCHFLELGSHSVAQAVLELIDSHVSDNRCRPLYLVF